MAGRFPSNLMSLCSGGRARKVEWLCGRCLTVLSTIQSSSVNQTGLQTATQQKLGLVNVKTMWGRKKDPS